MAEDAAPPHYAGRAGSRSTCSTRGGPASPGPGISVWGSRELRVRGRTSGEWRTTPVNLLTLDGEHYLVAPRGETQWVRNLRVAGTGELRVGRRTEAFRATEVADADKVPILRAYLKRWKAEVGVFFDGVSADSPRRRAAPHRPRPPRVPGRRSPPRDAGEPGGAGIMVSGVTRRAESRGDP